MKLKSRQLKNWKTSSIAGLGITAAGLAGIVVLISQLASAIVHGTAPAVSSLGILIEAVVSLCLLALGFTLMVVGADPFEEVVGEFRFESQSETDQR